MKAYNKTNLTYWNEMAERHVDSDGYQTAAFRKGANILDPIVRKGIGKVRGRKLLHLQCHFGLDTLSWARLGARVTGVDENGEPVSYEGTGLLARCLQHETDHTQGMVFGDRLSRKYKKRLFAEAEEFAPDYPADWPVSPMLNQEEHDHSDEGLNA